MIGLYKYYERLGFEADPTYIERFTEFYRSNADKLTPGGCFKPEYENWTEELVGQFMDMYKAYQTALHNRQQSAEWEQRYHLARDQMNSQYLDITGIPMYGHPKRFCQIQRALGI